MTIDTARLRLQPFAPEHLLALIEGADRFEERSGYRAADGLREFFVSGDVSPDWLAMLRSSPASDPWVHGFAVVHREDGLVIGTAGFKGPPDGGGVVEVAYAIVPAYQGQGYATEATRALLEFAFASDLVMVVRAHTLPEPNASTRVLAKCGFENHGEVVDPEDGPVWRWGRKR